MGKKIIIIPDSFKGSMSSECVTNILSNSAKNAGFETEGTFIADGGEGTVDCILNILGGKKESLTVKGPAGNEIVASYGITSAGEAVIEIAESSGITKQETLHPMTAGTYGFGQLILDALNKGVRKFLLGLGGSASTDCGMGMAAALGVHFYDRKGEEFLPCGERMKELERVDVSGLDPRIKESSFTVLSDVTNPLSGPLGASYIFAPQKGADEQQVKILDAGLENAAKCISAATGIAPDSVKGAGAAGGSGYGCAAFLNAKMESGIEVILNLFDFDKKIRDCYMVVTGEGSLDAQSLMGKVLCGIKRHAGDTPVVSFCGICSLDTEILKKENVTAVEIGKGIPLEESVKNGEKYLKEAADVYFKRASVV
ncbi:MAG: glycerate kinase [Lachnospiraceae bacterium]|nr:glycerate kinase [Lachnospiraceae bacterium]